MKFKLGQFRNAHEKVVHELYEKDGKASLSLYCAITLCPVLAAFWYCREKDPSNEELTKTIENVKLFYGITEVEE